MRLPLATAVVSGARADDGVYLPISERMRRGVHTTGRLCVGDGPLRALDPRASLARHQDGSVAPLPLTGAPAAAMDAWSTAGVTQGEAGACGRIWCTHDRGPEGRAAEGSALERTCGAPHRGTGLLRVTWDKPVAQTTQDVGRGRGSVRRAQRVSQHTRSPITPLARQADTSAARSHRCGWKACVTTAGQHRLSLHEAVLGSRHAYRVERLGNRRKRRGPIAPRLVTRTEPIEGLTSLLTLGVRG